LTRDPLIGPALKFQNFLAESVPPLVGWDTLCSRFELTDGGVSKFALPCSARVPLHLFEGAMAGDRHNFVRGGAALGKARCDCLAEGVRVLQGY
jgi:hypothetical protein